jgi:hypothetical protein
VRSCAVIFDQGRCKFILVTRWWIYWSWILLNRFVFLL